MVIFWTKGSKSIEFFDSTEDSHPWIMQSLNTLIINCHSIFTSLLFFSYFTLFTDLKKMAFQYHIRGGRIIFFCRKDLNTFFCQTKILGIVFQPSHLLFFLNYPFSAKNNGPPLMALHHRSGMYLFSNNFCSNWKAICSNYICGGGLTHFSPPHHLPVLFSTIQSIRFTPPPMFWIIVKYSTLLGLIIYTCNNMWLGPIAHRLFLCYIIFSFSFCPFLNYHIQRTSLHLCVYRNKHFFF